VYDYSAEVISCTDGDTVRFRVDQGFGNYHAPKAGFRLAGIDCPEKNDARPEVRKKAAEAARFVQERLQPQGSAAPVVRILTHKPEPSDKYGRWQADVYYAPAADANGKKADQLPPPPAAPWRFLNQELVDARLAKPYSGGQRSWTDDAE